MIEPTIRFRGIYITTNQKPWVSNRQPTMKTFKQFLLESKHRVIAVDLDGTLAVYKGYQEGQIGEPIRLMMNRVKTWLRHGHEVIIFTARADNPKDVEAIEKWLQKHGLPELKITNVKTPDITELWDDRATGVYKNQGLKR